MFGVTALECQRVGGEEEGQVGAGGDFFRRRVGVCGEFCEGVFDCRVGSCEGWDVGFLFVEFVVVSLCLFAPLTKKKNKFRC